MAWIEVHQSLPGHYKIDDLKEMLGIKTTAQAVGHMVMLWLWAVDNAPDGDISHISPRSIARSAGWAGKPDQFVEALKTAGFLNSDMSIHDWSSYAGMLINKRANKRASNRDRQLRYRDRHAKQNVTSSVTENDNNALRCVTSSVTENDRNGATVPNLTVPNLTIPSSSLPPQAEKADEGRNGISLEGIPTENEVAAYAAGHGLTINAKSFIAYYAALNWRIDGKPIRHWQSLANKWRDRGESAAQYEPITTNPFL